MIQFTILKLCVKYQKAKLHGCGEKWDRNFSTWKVVMKSCKQEVAMCPTLNLTRYTSPYQMPVPNTMVAEKNVTEIFKHDKKVSANRKWKCN